VFISFYFQFRTAFSTDLRDLCAALFLVVLLLKGLSHPWTKAALIIIPFLGLALALLGRGGNPVISFHFYHRIWTYVFALLVVVLIARYNRKFKSLTLVIFGIFLATIFDAGYTLNKVRKGWEAPFDIQLFPDHAQDRLTFYPYGKWLEPFGVQRIRYPELISKDFNFIGSRIFFTDITYEKGEPPQQVLQYLGVISNNPSQFKNYPYAIWAPLIFTRPYSNVFLSKEKLNGSTQHILNSFPQKFDIHEDRHGPRWTVKPLCDVSGYLFFDEITGDSFQARAVGMNGKQITLPFFKESQETIRISDSSQVTTNSDGLVVANITSEYSTLRFEPPKKWKYVAWAFWTPFLILCLCSVFQLLKFGYERLKA